MLHLDNQKIIDLHKDGLSFGKIAHTMGCSRQTIAEHLARLGYHTRKTTESLKILIDDNRLKQLYLDQKLSTYDVASRSAVKRRLQELGMLRNLQQAYLAARDKGIPPPADKGGRILTKQGYVYVKCPQHPRAKASHPYIAEHIIVWEKYHNRALPEGWHIHHLNGIKSDNRPSNLIALAPTKHREKYTTLLQERAKRIRELEIEIQQLRRALENSQMVFYVSEN